MKASYNEKRNCSTTRATDKQQQAKLVKHTSEPCTVAKVSNRTTET